MVGHENLLDKLLSYQTRKSLLKTIKPKMFAISRSNSKAIPLFSDFASFCQLNSVVSSKRVP